MDRSWDPAGITRGDTDTKQDFRVEVTDVTVFSGVTDGIGVTGFSDVTDITGVSGGPTWEKMCTFAFICIPVHLYYSLSIMLIKCHLIGWG